MKTQTIKNTFLYLLPILTSFVSCQNESSVDSNKSYSYFYSKDKSKILYDTNNNFLTSMLFIRSYKDVTEDVDNFSVISQNYGKDKTYIYYTYKPLINVDYDSFYWDDENKLPKDKNHVYLPTTQEDTLTVIKEADPETYENIHLPIECLNNWSKDKKHYFYLHTKTDADRTTLSFESPYLPFDNKYVFNVKPDKVEKIAYRGTISVIDKHMIYDKKRLYMKMGCKLSDYKEIDYKDINTFVYYDKGEHIFGIDKLIFIKGVMMAADNIDTESFEVIQYPYTKDKNRVYYEHNEIPKADPKTFELLNLKYSKDKLHVYNNGEIIPNYTPETFIKDNMGRYPTDSHYGEKPRKKRRWRDDD